MKKKWIPYLNLGLAVIMLFFALPKLGTATEPFGNVFWFAWIALSAIVIAANGNMILMSDEKKSRLQQIKRERALRFERKIMNMRKKQVEKAERKGVKDTA